MGSTKHPTDWERQREQLSAYLDGELSAAERAELERHLPGCADCRVELAELRRARTLLGSLPTPALPRSFALPTGGVTPQPRAAPSHAPIPSSRPAWYRASQWAGGIAASIGLFLLLGSAVLGTLSNSPYSRTRLESKAPAAGSASSTRTAAPARQSPAAQDGLAPTNTPSADRGQASPTPEPTATPTGTKPPGDDQLPIVPLTGGGLLLGGMTLLVVGRVARRRR